METEWDLGKHYSWVWIALIIYLVIGVIVNFCQFLIHVFVPRLRQQPVCLIVIFLSVEDFLFDLSCLIQCGLNLHDMTFFGQKLSCIAQALWAQFFMQLSGLTSCYIMYSLYHFILFNKNITRKEISWTHVGFVIYCVIISCLSTLNPGKESLNSSGIFCYTDYRDIASSLIFQLGFVLPLGSAIIYYYLRLYYGRQKLFIGLNEYNMKIEPKKKYVKIAKWMSGYIIILALVLIPVEITAFWEFSTGKYAPYQVWVTFALFGHSMTLLNPLLYYLLNKPARDIVKSIANRTYSSVRYKKENNLDMKSKLLKVLNDDYHYKKFMEYTESQYCSENLLFWKDVQEWKKIINNYIDDKRDIINHLHKMNIIYIADGHNKIYASLAINISSTVRQETQRNMYAVLDSNLINESKLLNIFNAAENEIIDLVCSDVFHRYLSQLDEEIELSTIITNNEFFGVQSVLSYSPESLKPESKLEKSNNSIIIERRMSDEDPKSTSLQYHSIITRSPELYSSNSFPGVSLIVDEN